MNERTAVEATRNDVSASGGHDAEQSRVLEDSESRYRRLFEAAQDGILILDAVTGQIVDANPFIERILGSARDELLGKTLWDVGLLADVAESRERFEELRRTRYVRYDHLPLENKTGMRTDVEFVSNVYEVDGQQVIQCNIRDITDRHRLEELAEAQARELAELARQKDEFLAMLSHELRNPVATIATAARLLDHQPNESDVQRRAQDIIGRQAAQLSSLVNDLLEVSRVTTGRIHLQRERVLLRLAVERAVDAVRPRIEHHLHELSLSTPEEAVWVDVDLVRFEQILANLLLNAVKYTEDGGRISIGVERDGETVVVRVSDNGIGISPELLPHVFDLFTQAEHALVRAEGGLGIGLALVKRLVELHDGTVEVTSILGEGSEFAIRLPLAPSPEVSAPPPVERPLAGARYPLRILLVDDGPDLAATVQLILEDEGHEVYALLSGVAAVETALAHRPDVVLLDIGMPDMDGFEVARRIRSEPSLSDLVLVAMTGYGRESDRQRSLEAGFDHHIVKPADFDVLDALLEAIGRAKHGDADHVATEGITE